MTPIVSPDRVWHAWGAGSLADLLLIDAVVALALGWVLRRIDRDARRDRDADPDLDADD